MKYLKSGRLWVIASFALFTASLMCGWTWSEYQTAQSRDYMLGRAAYMTTMYDAAADYFDKSYQDYNDELAGKPNVFKAPPSLELAELSQHFKALSLINMGNAKLAIIAFKESLKLTTEAALGEVHLSGDGLHKIQQDRKLTQIDFEILLHQKQDMAKQEGKGKGQPSDKKGEKQSDDPSNAAGKGDRNQL
jgi:hypothetical protein